MPAAAAAGCRPCSGPAPGYPPGRPATPPHTAAASQWLLYNNPAVSVTHHHLAGHADDVEAGGRPRARVRVADKLDVGVVL